MTAEDDQDAPSRKRGALAVGLAVLITLPGAILGALAFLGGLPAWPEPLLALVFGVGILGAALLLTWATEVVQLDIAGGLALALLALVAVLPEYAVDGVFAIKAGDAVAQYGSACQPPDAEGLSPCALALANMTGANRLLVGIGWPLVVVVAVLARRRARKEGDEEAAERNERKGAGEGGGVGLPRTGATEVGFLGLASLYGLTLPLRSSITLIDAAILVTIFGLYVWRISRAPVGEPDLIGTAAAIGRLSTRARRLTIGAMFVWAAIAVLLVAEHFANSLVETGQTLGISEFFLVQWVAPLASESPELVVASLYAWRLATADSLGTLVASKVNQWTLLVGTLPILFALSLGAFEGLPVDEDQRLELLLTAAQSFLAVTLLIDLRLDVGNAVALFVLFVAQFVIEIALGQGGIGIIVLSGIYIVAALGVLARRRKRVPRLVRDAFRTPYDELEEA